MVTPCPVCHLNLGGGQPKAEAQKGARIGLPIVHLPQLIGLGLGFNPDELQLKRHIVPTRGVAEKAQPLTSAMDDSGRLRLAGFPRERTWLLPALLAVQEGEGRLRSQALTPDAEDGRG